MSSRNTPSTTANAVENIGDDASTGQTTGSPTKRQKLEWEDLKPDEASLNTASQLAASEYGDPVQVPYYQMYPPTYSPNFACQGWYHYNYNYSFNQSQQSHHPPPSPTTVNEKNWTLEKSRALLLEDLPSTSSPERVQHALETGIQKCQDKPELLVEMVRMGTHSLILVAWKRWADHETIVLQCSQFLLTMVYHSHFCVLRTTLVKMGILDLAARSLQQFPECFELHITGLKLLTKVLEPDVRKVSCSAAVAKMNHEDELMVQREVYSICRSSSHGSDLCLVVLNAMMRLEKHVDIQRLGCQLLLNLWNRCGSSNHAALRLHLQQLGAAMIIGTSLERHPRDDVLVKIGSEFANLIAAQHGTSR